MTAFILLLAASLEPAKNDGEIKPDTNNIEIKAIFIRIVLKNALHNLN